MQNYRHTVHKLMGGNSNKNKDAPIKSYTATHICKNTQSNSMLEINVLHCKMHSITVFKMPVQTLVMYP